MWPLPLQTVRRVLCLGAHSDDIEIGLGGTLLALAAQQPDLDVCWVVFSAPGPRTDEARRSADEFLRDVPRKTVKIGSFHESYFPSDWPAIKEWFEQLKVDFDPDVVFTHCREDRHQDHRVLSDLAWNTFRNHLILEYEILKYDGDLGRPNVFMPLSEKVCSRKIELLLNNFKSQRTKHWFTADTFAAMLRIRGIECASASGRAEAFYGRKLVVAAL
ncbi:MAG TPA: PIG-L deacetylase family protein [Chthoniobacterales bacterium]